jgi:hypothetical protein
MSDGDIFDEDNVEIRSAIYEWIKANPARLMDRLVADGVLLCNDKLKRWYRIAERPHVHVWIPAGIHQSIDGWYNEFRCTCPEILHHRIEVPK